MYADYRIVESRSTFDVGYEFAEDVGPNDPADADDSTSQCMMIINPVKRWPKKFFLGENPLGKA